jgi:hypothetical protein
VRACRNDEPRRSSRQLPAEADHLDCQINLAGLPRRVAIAAHDQLQRYSLTYADPQQILARDRRILRSVRRLFAPALQLLLMAYHFITK